MPNLQQPFSLKVTPGTRSRPRERGHRACSIALTRCASCELGSVSLAQRYVNAKFTFKVDDRGGRSRERRRLPTAKERKEREVKDA